MALTAHSGPFKLANCFRRAGFSTIETIERLPTLWWKSNQANHKMSIFISLFLWERTEKFGRWLVALSKPLVGGGGREGRHLINLIFAENLAFSMLTCVQDSDRASRLVTAPCNLLFSCNYSLNFYLYCFANKWPNNIKLKIKMCNVQLGKS